MARRGHGEGTVEWDDKRKYYFAKVTYKDPKDGSVKRKKIKGTDNVGETIKIGRKWKEDIETGRLLPGADKITLKEWLDCWLEDYVKPNVRIKSYKKYKSSLENYVIPQLGKRRMKEIRRPELQRHFNELTLTGGRKSNGISAITARNTRRYLSMALDQAMRDKYLTENVIKGTKPPPLKKTEIHPLNKEQADALLAAAKQSGEVTYMAILLALFTGMRLGEVLGLKWEDIGDKGVIRVQRAVATGIKGKILQPPKTARGRRQIPLPEWVAKVLWEYRDWQDAYKKSLGDKFEDQGLVITNSFGKVLDSSRFSGVTYKEVLKKAGIDTTFTFHDLRHTHASMLLMEGVHPKMVQERLGHSTITVTLDTYSHLIPGIQDYVVEALDRWNKER